MANNSTAQQENTLFDNFHLAGPSLTLILPATILNVVAITGIVWNFSVFYVTIKSRSLRGVSNYLLAMISVFEIFHQAGHLLMLFIVCSGKNFIDLLTAERILFPSLVGLNAAVLAITLAAADRLFAILSNQFRKRINKMAYLALFTLASLGYGIFAALALFYPYALENTDMPTTGYLSDLFDGPYIGIWFNLTVFLNLSAFGCYLLIWIVIKWKKEASQSTRDRLLKSLFLIVLFNICGYLVNLTLLQVIYNQLFPDWYYDSVFAWELSFINGLLLNIGVAANAPILYFTSMDYKKAFKCHLIGRNSNTTNPTVNINPPVSALGSTSLMATRQKIHPAQRPIERVINNNASFGSRRA